MGNPDSGRLAGRDASAIRALREDDFYVHACGRYLELESMVRRLSDAHGIPFAEAWRDVVTGFDEPTAA